MYVGRIVSIGMTKAGSLTAMYRVSSRSFPNRRAVILENSVAIIPKEGFENDIRKNPYIAYNCLRLVGPYAVATNGSHTDPVAEKLQAGMTMRDALVTSLFALDYEHDDYKTPRIAAIVKTGHPAGYLGIVRHDALLIQEFNLTPGHAYYVCTYEHNVPCSHYQDEDFDAASPEDACKAILGRGVFAKLERPIAAASAVDSGNETFDIAVADA